MAAGYADELTRGPTSGESTRLRWRRTRAVLVLAVALSPLLAGSASGALRERSAGATATFALPPGLSPDYILPIESASADSVLQANFLQSLLYRPLYWEGDGSSAPSP